MHSKRFQPRRKPPGSKVRRGVAVRSLLCLLVLLVVRFDRRLPAQSALPAITTARAAHELDARDASLAYPVRLHAVVTFYDEYLDSTGTPVLFVTDATGSIYVALKAKPAVPPKPGDLVQIDGVSGPGLFAPIVDHASFQPLGTAPLPQHPPRVILADMVNGRYEGQWVEVEGLVQAVRDSGTHVVLDLLLRDGTTTAITARQPGVDYGRLVDSAIVLHGHASPNFNKQKQVTGAHLLFPGLGSVRTIEPGAPEPFLLPIDHIGDLLRFDPHRTFQHRVHIRGTLTLLWPGRMICIQDDAQGLCAATQQTSPLPLGDRVDLAGFPEIGPFTPTLEDADYRAAGGDSPVVLLPVTARQALQGDNDAQLVTLQGWIIDDNSNGQDRVLTLSADGEIFTVTIPRQPSRITPEEFEDRTLVRVTGICSVQSGGTRLGTGEGFSIPKSFSILSRSPADIVVLRRPSWWNALHSLIVLAVVFLVTNCSFGGLFLMRRRIRQQTATIRAQLAETHALKEAAEFQASHDGLTGLYNRKAVLDLLQRESELAARAAAPTGIIMLDLDHFKRINDTHGHAAGDDVIRESVRRILTAIRSTDLVGRYGGEEFIIVLPGAAEEEVRGCAERIRSAVCEGAISAQGTAILATASLGATAARFPRCSTHEAVTAADLALYEAKHNGRNQVAFRDPIHAAPPGEPTPASVSSLA
jgi:diguanylate cyclase (GGDEF)-like protein